MYISWIVILLGAEIVYLQGADIGDEAEAPQTQKKQLGLEILSVLKISSEQGVGASIEELRTELEVSAQSQYSDAGLMATLKHLVDLKIIIFQNEHYFVIRDLSKYSLDEYLSDVPANQWTMLFSNLGSHSGVDQPNLNKTIDAAKREHLSRLVNVSGNVF